MDITLNAVEISNGKKVLLLAPEDFDDEDAVAVADGLRSRFPECEWAVLTGGFQVIALENENS